MRAAEITDRDRLKAWLETQPQEVCVWIAARAGARALPVSWDEIAQNTSAVQSHVTMLPVFRALLTAASFAFAEDSAVKAALAREAASAAPFAVDARNVGVARAAYAVAHPANAAGHATVAAVHAGYFAPLFADARWAEAHGPRADHPLWPEGMPDEIADAWQTTRQALPEPAADQPDYRSFWARWYQGLLDGKPAFPRSLTEAVALIKEDDWDQGDLHINNTVIPGLMAEHGHGPDSNEPGLDEGATNRPRTPSRIRTVRAQVATLQEFLDAEVDALRGHNDRSLVEDDILEVLLELKRMVETMIDRLNDAGSDSRAVTVVKDDLPAIVEKSGELALVEPEPQVSASVVTMAATIRSLVDAGGDPKLATQFAIGEAANRKLWPRIKGLFGKSET